MFEKINDLLIDMLLIGAFAVSIGFVALFATLVWYGAIIVLRFIF